MVKILRKRLGQLRYLKHPGQIWRVLTSKVKSIELAINFVCNRRCPGCYARNLRAEQEKVFLTPEEVKEICKKYKPAHINLTGGEPMLNPKIFEIIKAIPKSTVVSMVTNGDLLMKRESLGDGREHCYTDYAKIRKLKECGLNTIQISYGSNYNTVQNMVLAFDCNHIGLNVCLSCTNIYKERENIKRALKLCEENNYQLLFNTPGVSLEPEFDYQTYFTYRRHPLVREDNLFWAGCDTCPAGIQKFYITADKSIYPCDRLHDKKYDSYEQMRAEFKKKPKVYCRRYESMCK